MKKMMSYLLAVLAIVFASCQTGNSPYQITITPASISMVTGDIFPLQVSTAAPSVTWKSSDENVAQVMQGVVSAVGVGHATITASYEDCSAVCLVSVTGKDGATLALKSKYTEMEKGETFQCEYTSSYDLPLIWASSNEAVAQVDNKGLVTALKPGRADITLTNGMETCIMRLGVKHHWGEYKLVWSDEFDGTSLNTDNWTIEVNGAGGGNQELQYYSDRQENIRVEDGNLVLQLRKEKYKERDYTSGRINSKNKKFFKYGKIESRICFPSGGGTWPAFWMMGNDHGQVGWPKCGEIDIIEHVGNDPRMCSFALHTPEKNGTRGNNWTSRSYFDDVENNYHIYGIEWIEEDKYGCDVIQFTFDGKVCSTVQESLDNIDENYYWPFNKEHFIIFNLAYGGKMGGKIDDTIFDKGDVLMKVDWVRIYQHDEAEK